MNYRKTVLLLLIQSLTALLFACECVPDINTPKIIEPNEYGNIICLNAVYDSDSIVVKSDNYTIKESLQYKKNDTVFGKIAEGISTLKIINMPDSSVIFNSMLNIKKNSYYCFLVYGKKLSTKGIFIEDNITELQNEKSYIRCFNLSDVYKSLLFIVDTNISYELLSGQNSQMTELSLVQFKLIVLDQLSGDTLASKDISLNKGYVHNLILRGSNNSNNKLEIVSLNTKFD